MIRKTNYGSREVTQAPAIAELRRGGLDPDRIRLRGIDRHGYDEFVLDENGNRVYGPGGSIMVRRRPWPSAFRWPAYAKLKPILRYARAWGDY